MNEAKQIAVINGSKINQKKNSPKKPIDPNVPDQSYGDFYCPVCDSHMNTYLVWETHVVGKKHIKNVKKGEKNQWKNSKYKDLPDKESTVTYKLKNVREPVIGLSYIHEIRRKEPNVPPIFNCFLCHASIATPALVVEHVVSMKHRMNYIKENSPEEFYLIEATNLKKESLEALILEASNRMENSDGRGVVKVKQERDKAKTTWKRHDDDFDLRWKLSKKAESWVSGPDLFSMCSTPSFAYQVLEERSTLKTFYDSDVESRDSFPRYSSKRKLSPERNAPTLKTFYNSDKKSRDSFARYSSKRKLSPKRDACTLKTFYNSDEESRDSFARYSCIRKLSPKREDHCRSSKLCYKKNHHCNKYKYVAPKRVCKRHTPKSERVKTNSFKGQSSENYQSVSSSRSLSRERVKEQLQHSTESEFDKFLKAFPSNEFLKHVLAKLDNIQLKDLIELDLLYKVIMKAKEVFHNQVPPEVKDIINQNQSEHKEHKITSESTVVSSSSTSALNQVKIQHNGEPSTSNAVSNNSNSSLISDLSSSCRNSCVPEEPSSSEQPSAQISNNCSPTVSPSAIHSDQNDTCTERSTLISIPGLTQPQETCDNCQNHPPPTI